MHVAHLALGYRVLRSLLERRESERAPPFFFSARETREGENRRGRDSDMFGYACGVLLRYSVLLQGAAT